jgi:N-acetylmuramoyl-L-alanine amidase
MPAALAEGGFISNPDTEKLLATETYKRTVAHAIAHGIVEFLGLPAPEPRK